MDAIKNGWKDWARIWENRSAWRWIDGVVGGWGIGGGEWYWLNLGMSQLLHLYRQNLTHVYGLRIFRSVNHSLKKKMSEGLNLCVNYVGVGINFDLVSRQNNDGTTAQQNKVGSKTKQKPTPLPLYIMRNPSLASLRVLIYLFISWVFYDVLNLKTFICRLLEDLWICDPLYTCTYRYCLSLHQNSWSERYLIIIPWG